MAKRKEIKVGQVRELNAPYHWSRGVAKARVLAVNQTAETPSSEQGRSPASYNLHEDMVLVEVLEENGWSFRRSSSRQDDERPLLDQKAERGSLSWYRTYKTEKLPEGQYLVKPGLLGAIWDQEAKDEAARTQAEHTAKRERYDAAVKQQAKALQAVAEDAGLSVRWPWSEDKEVRLSFNDLTMIIRHASKGTLGPDPVSWTDYQ